jgi:hypothetical protein
VAESELKLEQGKVAKLNTILASIYNEEKVILDVPQTCFFFNAPRISRDLYDTHTP